MTRGRRCLFWRHNWEYEPLDQAFVSALQIRQCVKCDKRELLVYYWGELLTKGEIE